MQKRLSKGMLVQLLLTSALICLAKGEVDERNETPEQMLLDRRTRVVNGEPVPPGLAEWQVSIQTKYIGSHFCGGSLIAPRWVLTACHCTMEKTEDDIRVGLGSNYVRQMTKYYNVKSIIRHEFYNTKTLINDIALLELDTINDAIPRGLPAETIPLQTDEEYLSENCYATGFGRLSLGGIRSERLMGARVPLYTYEECRASYTSNFYITTGHVCAGGEDKDACQGDSGGPLACCKNELSTAKDCTLVGVVTWGIGCARVGTPGVYTKVAHYKEWVDAKIAGREYEEKPYRDRGGKNFFRQLNNFFNNPIVP